MYGFKRVTSASHIRALFTSAAAATVFIQSKEGKIQSKNDAATLPKNDGAIYERTVLPPKPHPENKAIGAINEIKMLPPIFQSENEAIGASKERKVLPAELQSENVAMLTCESSAGGGICDVYLVGTLHNTPESKRQVEALIQFLKPEVVFLEMCSSRLTPQFEDHLKEAASNYLNPEVEEIEIMGDAGKSEFIAGYMQAMKCGAKVILGDRPIKITKMRAAANLSVWDMITIRCIQLKLLPKKDLFEQHLKESFLDERDQYMSAKILEAAREHNLVVAIVGKGHLEGIDKYWKQPVELEQLLSVPTLKNPMTTPLCVGSIIAASVIFRRRFIKK